jgi:hypothetical protein
MTNQEFEQKMNFIIEQQAQFAADLELRRIREEEFDRRHQIWKVEIEDLLTRLARVTNEGFKDVNAKINALVDSHIRMEEQQKKTDEQLRRTDEQLRANAEQQRKTDEQLRRTDDLLRRHLGGKRNGDKS